MRRTEVLQGLRAMRFEDIYGRWQERRLSQAEAAEILGMSERTFRRWRDRYDEAGADWLLDWRLGKASARRVPGDQVSAVLTLYRERYFTPTLCSWLNAVEGLFAKLTRRRLKRGAFHSRVALQAAINRYLAEHNHRPKPFVWTADHDRIIEKVTREHQALASDHSRYPVRR